MSGCQDWACAGTTGYDALALLDRLFVDPAGETALDDLDAELRGGSPVAWPAMTTTRKREVADGILAARGGSGWPGWCPT